MEEIKKIFGSNVRLYRQAKGLTLQEFADKVHKSKSTVSKYETGTISVDLVTMYEISNILNIPIYQLLSGCTKTAVENSEGSIENKKYLYSYIGRKKKIMKSLIYQYSTIDSSGSPIDNMYNVTLFYDIPEFDQPEKCRGLYKGSMQRKGSIDNYHFSNQRNSTEQAFLCSLESLDNSSYNMGIITGLSFRTLMPNTFKVLLSEKPMPEDDHLKELLLFDKEAFKILKKENLLEITRV